MLYIVQNYKHEELILLKTMYLNAQEACLQSACTKILNLSQEWDKLQEQL